MAISYPSVGSVTVLTMKGRVTAAAPAVEEITRRGVDGHAYVQVGKRAPECQLLTELDVSGSSGVATHINAGQALCATFVTVKHPTGETVANVAVLKCELVGTKKIASAVGGVNGGDTLCTLRWTVQASAASS